MAKENSNSLMGHIIKGILAKDSSRVLEFINGKMEEFILESGRLAKCMDKENSPGLI
jgi:hypothetical protein